MRTLHIAFPELANDSDYERIKMTCEDGLCDDVHVISCYKLRADVSFPSSAPERTVNNLMRTNYRVLTSEEAQQTNQIQELGEKFIVLLHSVGGTLTEYSEKAGDAKQTSRALSIAQTKIEEAVMWAVKHVVTR